MVPLLCEKKTRLLNAYMVAADQYATMASRLASVLSATRGDRVAFQQILGTAQLARQDAKRARLALKHHKAKHGC
jgi:hypothetical protein